MLINCLVAKSHMFSQTFCAYSRFFSEMGGGSSKTTVNYLISLIDRVHKIYEETVWRDSTGAQGFSGMGFIIKKIVVHRKPTPVREGMLRLKQTFLRYFGKKKV